MTNTGTTTAQTTHCHRCGRLLTDPRRVAAGYGRTCARHIAQAAQAAALTEQPARLAKATDLITDGGIVKAGHLYLAVSSDGHTRYEVAPTGECTCTAAQFGRRCYHATAAALLAA